MAVIPHYLVAKIGNLRLYSVDESYTSSGPGMYRRVVFRESFIGDGVTKTFTLTGAIGNATFSRGTWDPAQVEIALPADITKTNKKPLYDSANIFTRHRIGVDNINSSGVVTLDYIPRLLEGFYVWYWYELLRTDSLDNYYREDYVASMEGDLSLPIDAAGVATDTTNFDHILSAADTDVQKALETIDDHIHEAIGTIPIDPAESVDVDIAVLTASRVAKWLLWIYNSIESHSCEIIALEKASDVGYSRYAILGDNINYATTITSDGSNMKLNITNNELTPITVKFRRFTV